MTFNVTPVNSLVDPGPLPTAGWAMFSGAIPIAIADLEVTPGGIIEVIQGGIGAPNRLTYDGSDATIVDAAGATLAAFDHPIPYAT